jgi:hypothetical protein
MLRDVSGETIEPCESFPDREHATGGRHQQSRGKIQHRALSTPARADDRDEPAARNLEAHVGNCDPLPTARQHKGACYGIEGERAHRMKVQSTNCKVKCGVNRRICYSRGAIVALPSLERAVTRTWLVGSHRNSNGHNERRVRLVGYRPLVANEVDVTRLLSETSPAPTWFGVHVGSSPK